MIITAILFVLFYNFHDVESQYITTKLTDGVYSFVGLGYNSMFIVTTDGVIAIEPVKTSHAKKFLEAIKNVTNQPVKYLLISHNHWDHASGGQVFKDDGATTLVHAEAYEWMVENPGTDMIVPDESWEGKVKNITLGNTTITLYFLGMNHGLGMTVFVLPETKFAYIADLVTPNQIIFTFAPDYNMREMERTLAEILLLNFDRVIYSHDLVNSTYGGTKQEIGAFLTYIKELRFEVRKLMKNGTSPFAIPKLVKIPEYALWTGYDAWLEMNVWRMMTEDTLGPYPWRPERVPMCTVEVAGKTMCRMKSSSVPMCKEETKNGSPTLKVNFEWFFFLLVAILSFF